jgi:hypothetical protein
MRSPDKGEKKRRWDDFDLQIPNGCQTLAVHY